MTFTTLTDSPERRAAVIAERAKWNAVSAFPPRELSELSAFDLKRLVSSIRKGAYAAKAMTLSADDLGYVYDMTPSVAAYVFAALHA